MNSQEIKNRVIEGILSSQKKDLKSLNTKMLINWITWWVLIVWICTLSFTGALLGAWIIFGVLVLMTVRMTGLYDIRRELIEKISQAEQLLGDNK